MSVFATGWARSDRRNGTTTASCRCSATKAALWSATNSLRLELAPAGVHVVGVHVGYVDTAMAAKVGDPKLDPAILVATVLDATEAGEYEVLADDRSVQLKAALSAPLEALYPQLTKAPK